MFYQMEDLPCINYPIQPLLVNIALQIRKGCNLYYKLLRTSKDQKNLLAERENRWHIELGVTYSVKFWNAAYFYTSCIKNDNKLKWQQYQIVRNSQYTNYKVNKFNPSISPLCAYCLEENETISHLYFRCKNIYPLWQDIIRFVAGVGVTIPMNESAILFGIHSEKPDSRANILVLWGKNYIWYNKFINTHITLDTFKIKLKQNLIELREVFTFGETESEFSKWDSLLNMVL